MNTKEQIINITKENFDRDVINIKVYNEVSEVLKKFDGKKPSKLIANALVKAHPEYTVYFRNQYGMYHLEIYGESINRNYDNKISLLLAYDTNPIINMDSYAEHSTAYGEAAIERNNLRTELLNDDKKLTDLANAIDNLNVTIKTYLELSAYPMPDMYSFDKLINSNSRLNDKR